jgi:hypothetical protein
MRSRCGAAPPPHCLKQRSSRCMGKRRQPMFSTAAHNAAWSVVNACMLHHVGAACNMVLHAVWWCHMQARRPSLHPHTIKAYGACSSHTRLNGALCQNVRTRVREMSFLRAAQKSMRQYTAVDRALIGMDQDCHYMGSRIYVCGSTKCQILLGMASYGCHCHFALRPPLSVKP